jgi:hypothetical protein
MNTKENKEPHISTDGYTVTAINCQDPATARDLVSKRIRAIEQRLAEIKLERTALNREAHDLARLVYNAEAKEKRERKRKTSATCA